MNYKINQIKRLIESLDSYEMRELTNYLIEEVDVDINDLDVYEIAKKIENGELPETKELLMKTNEKGKSVAHMLANNSSTTNWTTTDKDVLILQDKNGWSVAHLLAFYSYATNWKTDDKDILMLQDIDGWSVAHELAKNSGETNWTTDDKEILMSQDDSGWSVARELAEYHPTWKTNDPEILSLTNKYDEKTVGDILREEGKI